MKPFTIKELIIDDDLNLGIKAISLVDDPAIQENFLYFNKEVKMDFRTTEAGVSIRDFYEYTAAPLDELVDNSHQFCKDHAGKVFHQSEINAWGRLRENERKEFGFIMENNFFQAFHGNIGSFNVNQQIYNCRHYLRRVNSVDEIPVYKRKMNFKKEEKNDLKVEFKVSNKEKREIEGLVLQSGQFIYRRDIEGMEGYVFFTRDTIRKLKERYGYNRSMTIQHQEDITGTAILLDSWLVEDDENNKTLWFLKYKIINDKLWDVIKNQQVKGYSIEGLFDFKQ